MENHDAFDGYREEGEFKALIAKARDLKIANTSFVCEVIKPIEK